MIKHYNISKYDRRDNSYLNDWTSIWQALDDECLSSVKWSDYLNVERRYLDYASKFIFINELDNFDVTEVQSNVDDETIDEFIKLRFGLLDPYWSILEKVKQGFDLSFIETISMVQLALRGIVWFKLVDKHSGAYLSFDTDYYFLIGVREAALLPTASNFALYQVEMNDPWE